MNNLIKTSKFISVTLDDGTLCVSPNVTQEFFQQVTNAKNDTEILRLFNPSVDVKMPSVEIRDFAAGKLESKYLVKEGNTVTIPSISNLSVPQDLVEAILLAENSGDEELVKTYLNFWTLVSLNPDARIRKNLFWFITRWNVKIAKSGLLITYRNVDVLEDGNKYSKDFVERVTNDYIKIKGQKQSPNNYYYIGDKDNDSPKAYVLLNSKKHQIYPDDDSVIYNKSVGELYKDITDNTNVAPVFTDHHSHSFRIEIGKPVSMPREKCDASDATCSSGLHQGSKGWLQQNYYGCVGLMCLVNPANVVNCPPEDSYGKMRCCEYLPVGVVKWDEDGHIEDLPIDNGFEDGYLLDYAGKINNEDLDNFTIYVLRQDGIDREKVLENIRNIASHTERYVE